MATDREHYNAREQWSDDPNLLKSDSEELAGRTPWHGIENATRYVDEHYRGDLKMYRLALEVFLGRAERCGCHVPERPPQ